MFAAATVNMPVFGHLSDEQLLMLRHYLRRIAFFPFESSTQVEFHRREYEQGRETLLQKV